MSRLALCHLGQAPYQGAWALQRQLRARRLAGQVSDLVLLATHPPTYTCGRSTRPEHLPRGRDFLLAAGASVVDVERGGSVTYHGPGQLVVYPILHLGQRGRDLHRYVRDLEAILVETLKGFGLTGARREGLTGVWVGDQKIAAIGVHVRQWVTMHGFSLNICPDLARFAAVRPCGLDGEQITSMERLLGHTPPWERVEEAVVENLELVLGGPMQRLGLTGLLPGVDLL